MSKMKKALISVGLVGLALLAYSPKKTINPVTFEDINGDGIKDAIVVKIDKSYTGQLKDYFLYNASCLKQNARECMLLNPKDYIQPILRIGYIDGTKIKISGNQYTTREAEINLGEIPYIEGLERQLKITLSDDKKKVIIDRPRRTTEITLKDEE